MQLVAPGGAVRLVRADVPRDGWKGSEAWLYLATEFLPLVVFVGVGVLFWRLGKPTRIANAAGTTPAQTEREPALD